MAGFFTNLRIWGATIFVDHYSDYVFVALMRDLTLDETLLAKTLSNDMLTKVVSISTPIAQTMDVLPTLDFNKL
jgi:hypothetical protein